MAIICEKAIGMIRCEEVILRQRIEHPQIVREKKAPAAARENGPLRWRSSMLNLMELICALYYSDYVTDASGAIPSFASFVVVFSHLFNFPIDRPYDMRARLAGRKKRLSVLLPKIKADYEKEIVKCGLDNK